MSETSNEAHVTGQDGKTGSDGASSTTGTDGQAFHTQGTVTGKVVQDAPGHGDDGVNGADGTKGKDDSPKFGDQDALAFYVAGLDWPNGLARLLDEMITSYKNKKKNKS
ncbi:hypothetical protein D3P07_03065 [Paenibacillus sp. 1011MAR3C5]|uniref:hypothetical protein n=1 Tax=Paenibacillus sp. 1011MAR3C5 TaxID=1675787 RepID=UPI000E6C7AF9|nr:hypothetical protein [Paenibacillus sp. 1011MAR3C5]RJE91066.1 hypothetical protein D3P07_03065 [Paenibacillus sp. 1011MAR3C5]